MSEFSQDLMKSVSRCLNLSSCRRCQPVQRNQSVFYSEQIPEKMVVDDISMININGVLPCRQQYDRKACFYSPIVEIS